VGPANLAPQPPPLEAAAQQEPGAVQSRPQVGRGDSENLADLVASEAVELAEKERVSQMGREPLEAAPKLLPELTPLKVLGGLTFPR
jgi:hypothetical protein